jgi:flagellin
MISIDTNSASSAAAYNFGKCQRQPAEKPSEAFERIRINASSDDAGGLAVSMKLSAAIRRTEATQANVNNSQAFLETQDGVLKSADKIVSRMSELAQLANDVTKSTSDLALYQTEVNNLKGQLGLMMGEAFNGISLFSAGSSASPATATTLSVVTSARRFANHWNHASQPGLGGILCGLGLLGGN